MTNTNKASPASKRLPLAEAVDPGLRQTQRSRDRARGDDALAGGLDGRAVGAARVEAVIAGPEDYLRSRDSQLKCPVDRILSEAEEHLAEQQRLLQLARENESRLKALCKEYDVATGCRGTTILHLRKAVGEQSRHRRIK